MTIAADERGLVTIPHVVIPSTQGVRLKSARQARGAP